MTIDLAAAVRAVAPLLEARAEATEALGTMPAEVADALRSAGLFAATTPRELGGLEADIATLLDIYETSARADGSSGWSLMANLSSTTIAAAFLADGAVKVMFGTDAPGIHAGMLGPVGVATETGEGFHVSGNWQFGSGITNANWVGMGATVHRDGVPATTATGLPHMLIAFAPRAAVELLGHWDVMGLVGTGSFDYRADLDVASPFTFSLLEGTPQRGGPMYGMGVRGLTAAGHAGFALGVGRRALDEILEIAKSKARLGSDTVANQQLFLHDYGFHDAALSAAKAYVYGVFVDAEATLTRGDALSFEAAARLRQSGTYATRVAADAARFAYTWAGSQALRNPSVIQRCFRDIHAGTQHIFVDNNTLTGFTQTMLMG